MSHQSLMQSVPTHYFLVKGVGDAKIELNAFDKALLNAKIGNTNLVRMSSIIPPACKRIEPTRLPLGALVPCAYAHHSSEEAGSIISAAVAAGIPKDPTQPGVIMEHSGVHPGTHIEEIARHMVKEAFSYRDLELGEIISIYAELKVEHVGSVFAAVVLWNVL